MLTKAKDSGSNLVYRIGAKSFAWFVFVGFLGKMKMLSARKTSEPQIPR
jgi:hypothetical protein